jgi:hypothetical protein
MESWTIHALVHETTILEDVFFSFLFLHNLEELTTTQSRFLCSQSTFR